MNKLIGLLRQENQVNKVLWMLVLGGLIVGPLAIFPLWGITGIFAKQILFTVVAVLILVLLILQVGVNRKVVVGAPYLIGAIKLFILALIFSALFSELPLRALFGTSYEVGTVASFIVLGTFLAAGVWVGREGGEKILSKLPRVILSLGLGLAVYQWLIFLAGFFTFTNGLVGRLGVSTFSSWYESAVWFGFVLVIAVLELSQKGDRPLPKLAVGVVAVVLPLLVLINFNQVWWGLIIILGGAYLISLAWAKNLQIIPKVLLAVLVISVLMGTLATPNSFVANKLNSIYTVFNRQNLEVRPNFFGSFAVAKGVYKDDLFFGMGPNNFKRAWQIHRPTEVNLSNFWNTDFNYGLGVLSSLAVTSGLIGLFGLVVLMALVLGVLAKALRFGYTQKHHTVLVITLATIYLTGFLFSYATDYATVVYSMTLIGILAGLFSVSALTINFNSQTFKVLLWPLLTIDLIIILAFGGWFISRSLGVMTLARVYSNYSTPETFDLASRSLDTALMLNKYDPAFYRTKAILYFQKAARVINDTKLKPEDVRSQFQTSIAESVKNVNLAIATDPYDYVNYMLAGQVYEALGSLKIEGSIEQATASYKKARELNPNNPLVSFSLARLGLNQSQVAEAKGYLNESILKKPNFSQGLMTLAQLDLQEGKVEEAKKKSLTAAQNDPNNVSALFQLGYLMYTTAEYEGAISVLARAVTLSPNQVNANAQYFIGLSLAKLGKNKEALDQFKSIQAYNPDNEEIKRIIGNLTAGLDPLTTTPTKATTTPKTTTKTVK